MAASEDVQYFQFDEFGNMFVYEPGSGFSGPSVKVEPGFEMSEVVDMTQNLSLSSEVKLERAHVAHELSIVSEMGSNISQVGGEIIDSTPIKR